MGLQTLFATPPFTYLYLKRQWHVWRFYQLTPVWKSLLFHDKISPTNSCFKSKCYQFVKSLYLNLVLNQIYFQSCSYLNIKAISQSHISDHHVSSARYLFPVSVFTQIYTNIYIQIRFDIFCFKCINLFTNHMWKANFETNQDLSGPTSRAEWFVFRIICTNAHLPKRCSSTCFTLIVFGCFETFLIIWGWIWTV